MVEMVCTSKGSCKLLLEIVAPVILGVLGFTGSNSLTRVDERTQLEGENLERNALLINML
jgi:hypothetical protein